MNENKHATETNWTDPDDAPELTDEFFRQADEYRGFKACAPGSSKSTDDQAVTDSPLR